MNSTAALHYAGVTEQPGQAASGIQLEMLEARYGWASAQAGGKDVLEVACGAGIGLPILAESARSVLAGDVDPDNLDLARQACARLPNVAFRSFRAPALPFEDESFDLLLLFEALYYLGDAARFLDEAHRVLRPRGTLLIVTVNPEWSGFNPSPLATRYRRASELKEELEAAGFRAQVQGAFPESPGWLSWATGLLRRTAVRLGLIPRTMQRKALFKRMFYGPLQTIPRRLRSTRLPRLEALDPRHPGRCRVLYSSAQKLSYDSRSGPICSVL